MNTIRSQNPSGRFLEFDPSSGAWIEVNLNKALEKTCQAPRKTNRHKCNMSSIASKGKTNNQSQSIVQIEENHLSMKEPEDPIDEQKELSSEKEQKDIFQYSVYTPYMLACIESISIWTSLSADSWNWNIKKKLTLELQTFVVKPI